MKWHFSAMFSAAVISALTMSAALASIDNSATPPPSNTPESSFLVRSPSFSTCELEGFISLGLARAAMVFKTPKENLLRDNPDAFQTATINELFSEATTSTIKNYFSFGAKKFYDCVSRENIDIPINPSDAATCYAHHEIQFFASVSKSKKLNQEMALARVKQHLASVPLSPKLIEEVVAMEYRTENVDDEFELRRFIFESCLLPDQWSEWYQSVNPGYTKP